MAEMHRLTVDEVVSFSLGADVLRDSVRWVCQQLMEAEVSELVGAEDRERNPERLTHRNESADVLGITVWSSGITCRRVGVAVRMRTTSS